jgi:hypothetical protein
MPDRCRLFGPLDVDRRNHVEEAGNHGEEIV